LRRGGPRALRCRSRGRERSRPEDQRRLTRVRVHEADTNPAVRLFDHLRGNVAGDELVLRGQHHSIALDAEGPVEHDRVTLAEVALGILVGFGNPDARAATVRHGARERHADIFPLGVRTAQPRFPGNRATHLLELQRLARRQVDHGFLSGDAALANGIEEVRRPRRDRRDVVDDLERRRLWREQLVARVVVFAPVLRRGWRGTNHHRDRQHERGSHHGSSSTHSRPRMDTAADPSA
jgi:hypothetical protein